MIVRRLSPDRSRRPERRSAPRIGAGRARHRRGERDRLRRDAPRSSRVGGREPRRVRESGGDGEPSRGMVDDLTRGDGRSCCRAGRIDVVAFSCTSGTVAAGVDRVARAIEAAKPGVPFTTPITAAVAAFRRLGVSRIAVLTPYVDEVNAGDPRLPRPPSGLDVVEFGSFHLRTEPEIASVSRRRRSWPPAARSPVPDAGGALHLVHRPPAATAAIASARGRRPGARSSRATRPRSGKRCRWSTTGGRYTGTGSLLATLAAGAGRVGGVAAWQPSLTPRAGRAVPRPKGSSPASPCSAPPSARGSGETAERFQAGHPAGPGLGARHQVQPALRLGLRERDAPAAPRSRWPTSSARIVLLTDSVFRIKEPGSGTHYGLAPGLGAHRRRAPRRRSSTSPSPDATVENGCLAVIPRTPRPRPGVRPRREPGQAHRRVARLRGGRLEPRRSTWSSGPAKLPSSAPTWSTARRRTARPPRASRSSTTTRRPRAGSRWDAAPASSCGAGTPSGTSPMSRVPSATSRRTSSCAAGS